MYLYNGRIYTLHPQRPRVQALLIREERIVAWDEEAERAPSPGEPRFDLEGRTVMPALTDAHIHLEHYALGLQKVDCETKTLQECLERVAERAQRTPAGQWILGHGWNQNEWPEGFGCAADLDAVAPQHPVYLTAKSLHAAWVNSMALRTAGLTPEALDPPGGRYGRDEKGRLNGILFESAMESVARHIPEPSVGQVAEAIRQAQDILWSFGLAAVHDFDRSRCFAALQILHANDELRLRVLKSIPLEDLPKAIALGLRSGFGDDWLRLGGVKIFMDGALGPQTAAMLQPYEGSEAQTGLLFMDGEELFEHGRQAVENGLSLAVHAIGDRANHEALKAFAQLRRLEEELASQGLMAGEASAPRRLRHRIEHVQLLHPEDAPRLAELGVIASMQPIHATSDMLMADRHWGGRCHLAYAWKTQLDHGAVLAFGSDAPVESPNPFWGLHAAVTRRRQDGTPGPAGWYPQQRLTLHQALLAYTQGPAYAAGWEGRQGALAPGYFADLIVLERDPFECPPEALFTLRPQATMVGGEWVYGRV